MAMMETIEKKKNQRIQTADAWRKYKRVSYQRQFEGLEYQANIDFVVSDAYSCVQGVMAHISLLVWQKWFTEEHLGYVESETMGSRY